MALDEPKEEDLTVDVKNLTFCVNKDLAKQIGGATVDMTFSGFFIAPKLALANDRSACGSCTSC